MPRIRIRHRRSPAAGSPFCTRRVALFLLSGLLFGPAQCTAGMAQATMAVGQGEPNPVDQVVAEAAQRFVLPERWIHAVMRVESAGDPRAVSSAGAMGLMQVMPETWAELRLRHRLGTDPFAPRDNILAGTAYLREMLDRYGNTGAMLAAYNAGPARYDDYLGKGRALPAETRAYVARLAPLLDGTAPIARAARPADWREAVLFVTDPDAASVPEDAASAASFGAAESLAPADASGIFVARSRRDGTP